MMDREGIVAFLRVVEFRALLRISFQLSPLHSHGVEL